VLAYVRKESNFKVHTSDVKRKKTKIRIYESKKSVKVELLCSKTKSPKIISKFGRFKEIEF
jgi:hypothetical protein